MSTDAPIGVLDRTDAPTRRDTGATTGVRLRRPERPGKAPVAPRTWRTYLADILWLGTVAVLLFAIWPATLGGWTSYVIVHGQSMNPTFASGDLAIVRSEPSYHVGDIVAYKIPKPSPIAGHMVIHRVKEITPKGILTQGDNRETRDEWYLHHKDIVGKLVLHVPLPGGEKFWGYVPWAFCLVLGVGVIWFLWPPPLSEDEAEADRDVRADPARKGRPRLSRRERRDRRAARNEVAQMFAGAAALVGAVVIVVVTLT